MTQAAQREDSGPGPRSYDQPCLIARALDVLGDRWTLLILRDLMAGLKRYSDILENSPGLSPNILSNRLKRLEAEGLVVRHYFRELPPRVEYHLTPKGWAVRPILLSLIEWARSHIGPFPVEEVGRTVSTDFAVRVLPAFTFRPERAQDLAASMVVEISDCEGCNTWTFEIRDGHLRPSRFANGQADVRLKTDTTGFFRFLRGEAPPDACGSLEGDPELAARIQSCFLAH
ncbi:MAG: winged helix-turn-helix transcriptional regulator [Chloroflexota bacterium]|jgi:DNA-binding HxlR family transcriptional regulator|nr:winged helix-turn-helix transcriptional regulator [Chloroflexota bacterium]